MEAKAKNETKRQEKCLRLCITRSCYTIKVRERERERERERWKQSLCVRALERLRCVCGKKEREGNGMGVVW